MSEYIREIIVQVIIDTNKKTIRHTFRPDNLEEGLDDVVSKIRESGDVS